MLDFYFHRVTLTAKRLEVGGVESVKMLLQDSRVEKLAAFTRENLWEWRKLGRFEGY